MAKLIIVEGPDNSGKSTFISDMLLRYPELKELKFPKRNRDAELFKIETANELDIFDTMFKHLDGVYIVDRMLFSNAVYNKIRGESTVRDYANIYDFMTKHEVLVCPFYRSAITVDFEDDNIKLSACDFNSVLLEYLNVYDEFAEMIPEPMMLVSMSNKNEFIGTLHKPEVIIERLGIEKFIKG